MSAPPTISTDHRRSSEAILCAALGAHDPLALAEAYHRTIGAGHACAWRLMGASEDVEALLYRTYRDLWEHPPDEPPLEGWVRRHCFALGVGYLSDHDRPAASPSTAALLPELGMPRRPLDDPAERAIAELDPKACGALVRAHDGGLPTWEQEDGDADAALDRALLTLAGGGEDIGDRHLPLLADRTLGLLPPGDTAALEAALADSAALRARARLLRRGRRRVEGLPPHPDMGQRILVSVLAAGPEIRLDEDEEPEPEPARRPLFARLLRR